MIPNCSRRRSGQRPSRANLTVQSPGIWEISVNGTKYFAIRPCPPDVRLVTDSGSADNAITALSNASLQIGQPPISKPATPITLTAAIGSPHAEPDQRRCASATKPMRSASGHRKACPRALVWYIGVVQKMTTAVRKKIRRSRSSVLSERFRAGASQTSSRSRTSWMRRPGNVLAAWRSLVRRGVLEEGLGKQRGIFSVKG